MLLAAFLVPFVVVCDSRGVGLLATLPQGSSTLPPLSWKRCSASPCAGFALQGRLLRKSTVLATALLFAAGILLAFPKLIATILGFGPAACPSACDRLCACSDWDADAMDVVRTGAGPDILIPSLIIKGAQPNAARPKHPRRRHRRRIGFGGRHRPGADG
jgi:hypothetical protein